uniref:Nucleoprotein n=1 Tax=Chamaemelum virus 1 TaxID=2977963 RepID=A0A9N7AB37_9RHAB|nr:TPA_asm: nucleocapsid protein [Chamaemelum virus 1]
MDVSEAELAERIKNFRSGANNVPEPTVEESLAPVGMQMQLHRDPLDEQINRYLSDVRDIEGVLPEYANLPRVSSELKQVETDFLDNKFLTNPAIVLERMTDAAVVDLGRTVIPMMASGFSARGVASLFVLAYHLREPTSGDYLFKEEDTPLNEKDITYMELSNTLPYAKRTYEAMPIGPDISRDAKGYAYLAASTLRMFTKSDGNYIKAYSHILTGYQRFHNYGITITPPQPTEEGLSSLSYFFSNDEKFKATLYRILYMGGAIEASKGMRKFLYEMHLAHTGMHVVTIFTRLIDILDCDPGLILTLVRSQQYSRQISALVSMLKLIEKDDDEHKRRMWRYGRIFDEAFMSPLQTKSCPQFVYILASALKSESSKGNQDILKIAQLADLDPDKKKKLYAIGLMIVKTIQKHMLKDGASSVYRILHS